MKKRTTKKEASQELADKATRADALRLIQDETFLYRAMKKIGELGVIGEKRNRLILFLAGLTRMFDSPVSVMAKGPSSSGKSNLIRKTLQIFPPECVITRASLSAKAPVHGEGSLKDKILYLYEYRGGKDAQYLLRLQQSEQMISHEYTTVRGAERRTKISEREGSPVIFTTTTESKVFIDDETRFQSICIDDSPDQTLAIMQARINNEALNTEPDLPVWHEAIRIISRRKSRIRFPSWFIEVAKLVPKEQVRVRRDWERFLTFCSAVALCRSFVTDHRQPREIVVNFSDYCVSFRILNAALASTVHTLHERELALAGAVRLLHGKHKRPIRIREAGEHLGWKDALVYKYVGPAVNHKLLVEVPGTRKSNQKLLEPVAGADKGFLPSPQEVLKNIERTGEKEEVTTSIPFRENRSMSAPDDCRTNCAAASTNRLTGKCHWTVSRDQTTKTKIVGTR